MTLTLWMVGYVIAGLITGRLSYVYWERYAPDSDMAARTRKKSRNDTELYNSTISAWWALLWPMVVMLLVTYYTGMAVAKSYQWLVLRPVHPGPGSAIPPDHPIWDRPLVSSDFEDPVEGTPADIAKIEERERLIKAYKEGMS